MFVSLAYSLATRRLAFVTSIQTLLLRSVIGKWKDTVHREVEQDIVLLCVGLSSGDVDNPWISILSEVQIY